VNVREAMTARPATVAPGDSVASAAAIMRRGRFRHLPVVDDDVLVGVVSERDLYRGDGVEPSQRAVRSVMSAETITIAPDDPLEEAARIMLENKVGCLPVVEEGRLTGIVTESDIFRAFVDVLGVLEPGTRIQIRTSSLDEALTHVVDVARRAKVRIVSINSERGRAPEEWGLVVRFGTVTIEPLLQELRSAGLDVLTPDPLGP
jgi:acetoin utilization protein AcuB